MERRQRVLSALAAATIVAGAVAAAVLVTDSDDTKHGDGGRPSSTTTTSTAPVSDTSTAVWPVASSTTRYGDPMAAAAGFATDYLGFTNPVVGELRQGDSRSGEVDIQPFAEGPVTTALVRQLGSDDSWWILGAFTANIQIDQPAALARIASPVTITGSSSAFEGTVQVEVRDDASAGPRGQGFVTGGANGVLGPFTGAIAFTTPTTPFGSIILFTLSAEDGRVLEAAVLRVGFA